MFGGIALEMPEKNIMARLGYHRHRTEIASGQRLVLMRGMAEAFGHCRPRGAWRRLGIREKLADATVLEDGTVLRSAALARLFEPAHGVWLAAVTVGGEVSAAAASALERGDGAAALVCDAVGSETADAALDCLQEMFNRNLSRGGERLSSRRFSPGYQDLDLSVQHDIFRLLELEKLGMSLTEKLLMLPEKSVTALAGIENNI